MSTSETHETIEFDIHGECNICNQHKFKRKIDWFKKSEEFNHIIDKYRSKYPYDCIVPFSEAKIVYLHYIN